VIYIVPGILSKWQNIQNLFLLSSQLSIIILLEAEYSCCLCWLSEKRTPLLFYNVSFFIISVFWTNIIFQYRDSVWTTKYIKNAVIIFINWQYFILGSNTLTVCVSWSRINAPFVLLYVVVSKYLSFRPILYLITETLCLNKKTKNIVVIFVTLQ
jgi:hypothetical protein